MAKTMAQIKNGTVVNMLWCPDSEAHTDTLIEIAARPVGIGDTYAGTDFYRDGTKVLTPMEAAQAETERLRAENADMAAALNILEVQPDE